MQRRQLIRSLWGLAGAAWLAGCGGGGGDGGGAAGAVTVAALTPPVGSSGDNYPLVTFSATGGTGSYTWSETGALPPGLGFSADGQLSGVPTNAGTYAVTVIATDTAIPAQSGSLQLSLKIDDSPMRFATDAPPAGTLTYAYGFAFNVLSGGSPPYTWAVASGTPPPGLTLGGDGTLSGTPTSTGTFGFTVAASDSAPTVQTVSLNTTVTVGVPATLAVDPTQAPPVGTHGSQYPGFSFVASGGYLPQSWSQTAGMLPAGVALGPDGSLSGIAAAAGSFTFTATVTDSNPTPAHVSTPFTVVIQEPPPPTINQLSPPTATAGAVYAGFQFSATDGLAPLVWSETGGLAGLSFSLDGVLAGTPTTAGRFPISVDVRDALNRSAVGVPFLVRVSAARAAAAFAATASLSIPRLGHTATLLADGKVLVAGGQSTATAELYDPAAATFAVTGPMTVRRNGHTATLLKSGKVLLVGGGVSTAELYDPAAGTFTATGYPLTARTGQSATLLRDGRVLIAAGGAATAELYDPVAATFSATGSLTAVRSGHFATLLADGTVFIVAGGLATAEVYDPATGLFSAAISLPTALATVQTATRLADGRVLLTANSAFAQVYDPATGLFSPVGDILLGTIAPTANLLQDGTVLLAGGYRGGRGSYGFPVCSSRATAERFAPESEGFTATGSLVTARSGHTATLLNDGSVLIAGGGQRSGYCGPVTALASAELYK